MLRNYVKIVLRSLWRYKSYTLINMIGLGIGIAAMVWAFQTYRFSFSFDNFHTDRNNVYRALTFKEGAEGVIGLFPMALVNAAKNNFSGIEKAVPYDYAGVNIKADKADAFAERVHFTDAAFFDLFNFPLLTGDNNLADINAVVITETVAKKYFGDQDAIGKTLLFYAGETYARRLTVRGVLKDIPLNSTIRFGILTNFDNQVKPDGSKIFPDDWGWFVDAAFFKINGKQNAKALEEKMKQYLPLQNKAREDWKISGFKMMTLEEQASKSDYIQTNGLYERPADSAAFGPLVLAFLIFLSACLNFSNTTVARSNSRLKEIGMRKVMGSTLSQLITQILFECLAIVIVAAALSVVLNKWWLLLFNSMFNGVHVEANYFQDATLLSFITLMAITTSLLAGAYPAFYISRFNPTSIFRGSIKFGGSNLFSRVMLGFQLSIAIITVIAGIAFAKNAAFQRSYDYGYRLSNIMGVFVKDENTFQALKNEISKIPEITGVAGTRQHIGFGYRNAIAEAGGIKKEANYLEIGSNYFNVMGLKIAEGRPFDAYMQSDYENALMVTQKFAAMYGWKDTEAPGKKVYINSDQYTIVGVVKDFHSSELFDPLAPIAMKLVKDDKVQCLVIAANPADLTGVYNKTKDTWKRLFPLTPFNGFYQNEITAEAYQVTSGIAKIFFWFAIISILLTATGLFALVSLTVLKKMKEIALRKVVGAKPVHILVLVNKNYFWIFIISSMLGCYGGWSLTRLLLDLIFKINVGIQITTLTGSVIVLFIIAAITTGVKVWQAVRTSPVKLLRNE